MCKSYLNTIDRQNIQFDQSFFSINGDWQMDDKQSNVHCAFKQGAKSGFIRPAIK
jgi:DNA replication and repair protein RecF